MLFSSLTFLFYFLPVVVLIHRFLPEKWQNPFLFAASLVFYAWGEIRYLHLFFLLLMLDWAVGVLLAYLARRSGAVPRGGAEVDVFPGRRGTLLLVRPAGALTAAVADYALPYIHKYFTD